MFSYINIHTTICIQMHFRERDEEIKGEPREEVSVVELESLRIFENRKASELIVATKSSMICRSAKGELKGEKEGFRGERRPSPDHDLPVELRV